MPLNQPQHFSSILASTVHDIKNSLTILQDRIRSYSARHHRDDPDLLQLQFEANRMNHSMMQLLALYKIDQEKFNLDIDAYPVEDMFEEVSAQQGPLLQMNGMMLALDCSEELICFCDFTQISNALGTILNNAQRYSRHKILLSATQEGDYVCFMIEDDGVGYARDLLELDLADPIRTDWVGGSTGLGLYFVAIIASLHQNGAKRGYIRLDNESRLGGARFRLFLP